MAPVKKNNDMAVLHTLMDIDTTRLAQREQYCDNMLIVFH